MTLSAALREKSAAIAERWLGHALAAYPADSAALFRREKDRFANPVGHALREGTRAAVEGLLEGRQPEEVCSCLDEIVKIRAVQELAPSQAISFVFSLKEALRAELGREGPGAALGCQLAELEGRIDRMALGVFDIYMRYRGQICELRLNEVKRNVAKLMEAAERRGARWQAGEDRLDRGPLERDEAQRGGGQ